MYYAKCLAEKGLVFWASPLSLYIFRHCALPSLCEASHNDGLGENFEQRGIRIGGEQEVYAHLWQSEGWSIQTEQERFGLEQAQDGPRQVQGGMNLA